MRLKISVIFFYLAGYMTALTASSKTVLSPFCVLAEHSRYLTAPMSLHRLRPWIEEDKNILKNRASFVASKTIHLEARCEHWL